MSDYDQPDPTKPKDKKPDDEDGLSDEDRAEQESLAGFDEASPNLVEFFAQSPAGRDFLKRIAEQVCMDRDDAWSSSQDWRDRMAENQKIITGKLTKKTLPFEGCANVHMPIAFERLLRLVSNTFVEIFLERDTIFGVKPTGPDDYGVAEALTIHGNWQIQNEQVDTIRQQHRGLWDFYSNGSVFAHSYRDEIADRNRHDILQCDEFWMPYVWTSNATDLSDVPFKGRTIFKYRVELEQLRDTGKWFNVEAVLEKDPPAWDLSDSKARENEQKNSGIVAPTKNKRAPYVFYEYHGTSKMPGADTLRPICATVDMQTKTVVKLFIREEEDWKDRERFDQETVQGEQYQQEQQMHAQLTQQTQQLAQQMQSPDVDPEEGAMIMDAVTQEGQLQPPVPPAWMEQGQTEPAPIKKAPIEYFHHGVCVENPFGTLGMSFGQIEADLNRLANEALNRYYDSATLANVWSILTPHTMDLGTNIPFGPGKQIKVKGMTGEDIKKSIVELKPGPANPQLLDIVRMAQEAADSAIAAPSVLSGEPGKSGETFRGLATRVEKATRQLSAAGIKYLDFFSSILKANARLNSLFLPDEQVLHVLDHLDLPEMLLQGRPRPTSREMRKVTIARDMYRRNYQVTFTADVRFASQAQRISEADELVALSQHPALAGNFTFAYHAISKALRARGQHDMIPTLGPPPPMPEMPMGTPPPMPPGMEMMGPGGGPPPMGGGPPAQQPEQGNGAPPEVNQEMVPPEARGPVQGPQ